MYSNSTVSLRHLFILPKNCGTHWILTQASRPFSDFQSCAIPLGRQLLNAWYSLINPFMTEFIGCETDW